MFLKARLNHFKLSNANSKVNFLYHLQEKLDVIKKIYLIKR